MKNRNIYESPIIEEVKLDTNMSLMLQSVEEFPDEGPGESQLSSDNSTVNQRDLFV